MKKKVLFLATVLRGHILVFHLPYMQWFREQGYEVHCCAGNDTGVAAPNVPNCDRYIEINFRRNPFHPGNIAAYRRLKALIDSEEYELIHCHTPVGGMLGRLAARKARRRGTKVCYTAHGFHFFTGASWINWLFYYPAERALAHFTDLLITINQEDFQRAKRFRAKKEAFVHGVGVDLRRFDLQVDPIAIKKSLGIDSDLPMIISVGEHSRRKNHVVCIRALEKIEEAALVFCGVGKQEKALRQLAETCHVSDRVHFLGFRSDIPALLLAADAFIFPSLHEGLPVALMEAMAAGLPCVVSGVRGNTDLIAEGEGGFVVKPFDTAGFASSLRTILGNGNLRRQMSQRNRAVIQQYSLPQALGQTAALYLEQLGKRGNV